MAIDRRGLHIGIRSAVALCLLLSMSATAKAHEVPPMTRHELARAADARLRISGAGVKSLTRWRFVVRDGVVTDEKQKVLQEDFDPRGNKIRIVAYQAGEVSQEVRFTFNDSNQMLTDTDFDAAGKMTEEIRYQYLPNGLVASGVKSNGDGRAIEAIAYQYDADSIIVVRRAIGGGQLERTIYGYQRSSALADYSTARQLDDRDSVAIRVVQIFNARGPVTEKRVDFADDAKSYVWLYTDFSQHDRWARITKQMKHGSVEYYDDYSFDPFANPTEIRRYQPAGELIGYTGITFDRFQ